MPSISSQVTLFGATGYTGQLVAMALTRAEVPFRIAGRSAEKLARLSAALPNHPQWLAADANRSASLPSLFQDTRLLINCAGPFTDLGERVISQAALSGTHYLDMSNELGYVFRARGYHDLAQKTGAALVPACGFEVALADCAAHLVGLAMVDAVKVETDLDHPTDRFGPPDRCGPIDEVTVVYMLDMSKGSSGTRRSAVRSLATSWVAYRDGAWVGQIPGRKARLFTIPDGNRFALSFPSCESITIPTHLPVRRVNTWMATSRRMRFWGPLLVPLISRLSRSILRGPILAIAARGGKSSSTSFPTGSAVDADQRKQTSFAIFVAARSGKNQHSALLSGSDPYGLTAEIIAYTAKQMIEPGYIFKGMLAPAQAFDPRALIDYAQNNWGLKYVETTV